MGRPPEDRVSELKNWLRENLIPVVAPAFLPEEGDPLDLIETEITEQLLEESGLLERIRARGKAERGET